MKKEDCNSIVEQVIEDDMTDMYLGALFTTSLITISQEINKLLHIMSQMDKDCKGIATTISQTLSPDDYEYFKYLMQMHGKNLEGFGLDFDDLHGNPDATHYDLKEDARKLALKGYLIVDQAFDQFITAMGYGGEEYD